MQPPPQSILRVKEMAVTFQQAFEAACRRFPPSEWTDMPPSKKSAWIYREMRALDAQERVVPESDNGIEDAI
jgi:hypothetical protein